MGKALSSSSVVSYALDWYNFLAGVSSNKTITISNKYRKRAVDAKKMFDNDVSGLSSTISDFMVKTATVNFKIETKNNNLDDILNDWAESLNIDYSTYIPTGIKALAEQYFIERWRGSSQLLLRVGWGMVGDMELPTQMVFVAGEDIVTERPSGRAQTIDNVKYSLRIDNKNSMKLPAGKDETIYVRKPYDAWTTDDPVPFTVRRGIYYNVEFMRMLLDKTSWIVSKAMKYIFHIIQGSEAMELQGVDTYSKEDLDETKDKVQEAANASGTPVYATNWDTTLKHMIPDYEQVVKQTLFTAMTQRILNGWGVMEIEQSARKEDYLNPKPMIAEVENAMEDFAALIEDVLKDVKKRNQQSHPKYFRNVSMNVWTPPVIKDFLTQDLLDHLRSAYDRGDLSKESYATIFGLDWEVEQTRRANEAVDGIDELMSPHATQVTPEPTEPTEKVVPEEDITDDKKGPEKKNYKSNIPAAKKYLEKAEAIYKTIRELPKSVKKLPKEGQQKWFDNFNKLVAKYSDEDKSRTIAWKITRRSYVLLQDKTWIKKK